MAGAQGLRLVPDDDIEAEIGCALRLLGPVADQAASRAPVAQYEADIGDPAATRKGTSIAGSTGPLPRFLPVRDILRIAFNIEMLVPHGTVPRRQERSPRSPTDDNLATALPYAPTLLDALELMARYGDAAVPWYQRAIVHEGDRLVISYWPTVPIGRIEALATEVAMGTIHRLVETFVGPRVEEARVVLSLPPVSGVQAMQERFSCTVEVAEGPSRMVLPAAWGRIPSPYQDPELWQQGVARCEADIALLAEAPLVSRVRIHVVQGLEARRLVTIEETARALNMSARTLVRSLQREGHTHHRLLDRERRQKAEQLLAGGRLPLGDIAEALAFTDQSSFGRKCRDWFGTSPLRLRRELAVR
jgi:AraC-like DNA-binding protein